MIENLGRYEKYQQEPDQIDRELHEKFKPGLEHLNKPDTNMATDKAGEWIEVGHQNIPVDRINVSESSVHSANDFNKVSFDEMEQGMKVLDSEVRPAVETQGASRGYFEQLDRSQPLDGDVSRTKVYDSFYGEKISSVRVAKVGDHYEVENGYHRVFVAKELNMSSIPAWVKVKV